jgi:hypothetical protein
MAAIRRIAFGALTAACVIAVFASIASASRALRFNEKRIQLSTGALTIEAAGLRITCEAKLTLSLTESRVEKRVAVIGELRGTIPGQEREAERCEGGRARFLPFAAELLYLSFTGTLPAITGITFGIEQLRILTTAMAGLMQCLIEAPAEATQVASRGGFVLELRGFTLINTMVINLAGLACPRAAEVRIRGTFNLVSPRELRVELL